MKEVYSQFIFNEIVSDNGTEFKNEIVENWSKENNIRQHFAPAYHQKGPWLVYRVNQILRYNLNKSIGPIKTKSGKVTENYKNKYQRSIGMAPSKALFENNYDLVRVHTEKYKNGFVFKELPQFKIGQEVLVKNEIFASKNDKKLNLKVIISEVLPRDT